MGSAGARVALAVVIAMAAFFAVYWVTFAFLPFESDQPATALALAAALGAGWLVYAGAAAPGVLASTLRSALTVGGIGFLGGFVGPIVFAPDANQGPLLGIFVTGPLGFLIGGVGGFMKAVLAPSQP